MKILYFIVSINLAAATTLATQLNASAEAEATSDKANWLKASIGALESNDTQSSATPTKPVGEKAVAQSLAKLVNKSGAKTIVLGSNTGTVKLMPFVPNRKLPSKRDLETALVGQTARMAPEETKPLTGQVSVFDSPVVTKSVGQIRTSASPNDTKTSRKTWSNLIAATKASYSSAKSSNLSFPFLRAAEHALLDQEEHSTSPSSDGQTLSAKPDVSLDQQMLDQYSEMQREAKLAQTKTNKQTNSQSPGMAMVDQIGSQGGVANTAAGPAPFPLSLLPQASLKQLVRGIASRPRTNGPAAYFGCWHNNRGLSAGSFHQYTQANKNYSGFGQRAPRGFRIQRGIASSRPANQTLAARYSSNTRVVVPKRQSMNKVAIASNAYQQPRVVKVAAYPAYPTANRYLLY